MACGKLEIDILNSVWKLTSEDENRDISIQDVVDDLSAQGVERAYTTIKTVMDRLTAKSILVRYKSGKKFYYSATMNKEEMAVENLKELSSQFFDSNYVDMIRFIERNFELVK
ncbi:MAG: BlaI/MecI/CopY family transcriptional regulator [Alphaproteobacteria bacterium]|jgi:predicted transcriptional regulator|nr:BlaI/MecI/CopY family transcriptional regulator [Alphaproteobacteria bacterium]